MAGGKTDGNEKLEEAPKEPPVSVYFLFIMTVTTDSCSKICLNLGCACQILSCMCISRAFNAFGSLAKFSKLIVLMV